MTGNYSENLATSGISGTFPTLLRWRGSLYKALYPWILIYIALFYAIALIYEYALDEWQQFAFWGVSRHVSTSMDSIPVILMLGFFVNMCVSRWWTCYTSLPETDMAIMVAHYVFRKEDDTSAESCKTFCRYMKTCWIMSLGSVAAALKLKFPDNASFETHGLLSEEDLDALAKAEEDMGAAPKPWLIMIWVRRMVQHSQLHDGLDETEAGMLMSAANNIRGGCGKVTGSCSSMMPLIATQLCIFTVHAYGLLGLIGKQYTHPFYNAQGKPQLAVTDFYLPVFSILPYILYCGWLRVGEITLNPFGDDDDDINILSACERNFRVARVIEQHFNDPETFNLNQCLFDEDGSPRPYFHVNPTDAKTIRIH